MKEQIKIMIVDDQNLYLESVKMVLETQPDFKVIGLIKNGKEAIEKVEELNPDIILMDISMSEMDGIDASEIILEKCRNQKIILVSSYSSRSYVSKALQMGIAAYVLKDEGIDNLMHAIRMVIDNGEYYSSNIIKIISELYRNKEYMSKNIITDKLSPIEIEVLKQWATGKLVKESADLLDLSQSTVDKHRKRIREKLALNHTADAVVIALRTGLVRIEDIPETRESNDYQENN